jgi:hypothetical protein
MNKSSKSTKTTADSFAVLGGDDGDPFIGKAIALRNQPLCNSEAKNEAKKERVDCWISGNQFH